MATFLTLLRLLSAPILLFLWPFSTGFWCLYALCGLTDMIDGTIARRTHTESERGAMLDSVADLVFAAVCGVRLLPLVELPGWLWCWAGLIAVLRLRNLLTAVRHREAMLHTPADKLTGGALFLWPLTVDRGFFVAATAVLCAMASFAAAQEYFLLRALRRKALV